MKLHRQKYPPEFLEELLCKQIDDFTWRIRALIALQWLSGISAITVGADTFCAFIWGFTVVRLCLWARSWCRP